MRFSSARLIGHSILASGASLAMAHAWSADVALAGLLPGRAVIVVDGGNPRTLAVGSKTAGGIKLLAVENGAAVFDIEGKRHRLVLGEQTVSSGSGGGSVVTLIADGRGQFFTGGSVNGAAMRFMVDTGATFVSLSAADAARAGLDYRKGEPGATVRLGDITLHQVDVSVSETSMPMALLGMSFLNRVEMKRDGDTMILKKRY